MIAFDTIAASPDGGWLHQRHGGYRLYWRLAPSPDAWAADVERAYLAAVPAAVLESAPTVRRSNGTLTLASPAGTWTMPYSDGWRPGDPKAPADGWQPARLLTDGWRPLLSCMGSDQSRPALCGLEVVVADGQLQLASTDGWRLATWRAGLAPGGPPDGTIVMPADAARWLAKQRNWAWQSTPDGLWASGLGWVLEAEHVLGYPDYRKFVLEAGNGLAKATVEAGALQAAVKQLRVGDKPRRLAVRWSDGQLLLTGRGFAKNKQPMPSAAVNLAAATEGYHGDEAMITLDPDLLHGMLQGLDKKLTLHLHWISPNRPLSIVAGDWILIIMACRADS